MAVVLLGGLVEFRSQGTADAGDADADRSRRPKRGRPARKPAMKEARGGDLGAAAMTALGDGDQVLATFLKGLELYQKAQLDRAAMQFQSSMQMAPTFAPSRLFLGATLAEANRHTEAAGLFQSAADRAAQRRDRPARRRRVDQGRSAAAGDRAARARRAAAERGAAHAKVARHRLRARRPRRRRGGDADAVPRGESRRSAALLAAIFGTYLRHLQAPAAGDARRRSREYGEVVEGLRGDERARCSRSSMPGSSTCRT